MTWMLTSAGFSFDIGRPKHQHVDIEDIAHHLATSNRFNGAARRPYSVAEHSLLVLEIVEHEGMTSVPGRMAALLHDGHEAYLGDIIQPVKEQLAYSDASGSLRALERGLERVVLERFKVSTAANSYRAEIKRADMVALATEKRDLLAKHDAQWACLRDIEPASWVNVGDAGREAFTWRDWRQAFLDKFAELTYQLHLLHEAGRVAE